MLNRNEFTKELAHIWSVIAVVRLQSRVRLNARMPQLFTLETQTFVWSPSEETASSWLMISSNKSVNPDGS